MPPVSSSPIAARSGRARSALAVVVLASIVACAPSPPVGPTGPPAERTTGEPVSPPSTPQPSVVLPDGFEVTLELAITPEELSQGLMFRPHLAEDRGMLLIFAEERLPNIWMMNTLVALDLVYLDSDGVVVDLITDAQPCPAEPCPRFIPTTPSRAVLEIPAGAALEHRVEIGEPLEFVGVPGFPTSG